jgi:ribonucleotide reductase beta subunit family protein with ferritin-like domain
MTNQDESKEYLLTPETNRYNVFPIKNIEIWNMYKKMQAAFWTAEEIDWSKDKYDFDKLNKDEQKFIKYVLAFFSSSDIIINITLAERIAKEIQPLEAVITYQFQMMIENVHSEVYSMQIDNIIRETSEKYEILNSIENVPCIKKKMDWMLKWVDSTDSFGTRLIAQVISEGLFFSGSFCAIFWLKQKNIMPGLITSNELISRDENMHTEFSIMLYHMLSKKLSTKKIHDMFTDAVETEKVFICESLPCSLLGMNASLMEDYIKFVADTLLVKLDCAKLYNINNPFTWMEMLSMDKKANFFETRPSQYQKSHVLNENTDFGIDDEF